MTDRRLQRVHDNDRIQQHINTDVYGGFGSSSEPLVGDATKVYSLEEPKPS